MKTGLQTADKAASLALFSYAASITITPICLVQLSAMFSLSLSQGSGIEAVRAFFIVITLTGSTFIAAVLGKMRSLAAGALLMGSGLLFYALAPGYGLILVAAAFVGAGGGLIEALVNPLVQELHPSDSGRHLNTVNAFFSVGVFATVLLAGELLTRGVSWRPLLAVTGLLAIVTGLMFLLLGKKGGVEERKSMSQVLSHKKEILTHRRFPVFAAMMFLAGGTEGAFTFWSATYIQLHFGALARMGGVGTACFAGGMLIGRFAGGHLVPQRRIRLLIAVSAGIGFFSALAVPFLSGIAMFFTVVFAAGLSVACFWPSIQSYGAERIPSDPTALFVLLSFAGIPGFGAVPWIMGMIGDRFGLRTGFFILPVLFIMLLILLAVESRMLPAGKRRSL
jgi:fucose permease